MLYRVGMFCKHFKGTNLLEKNIYQIEALGLRGKDIGDNVTYVGEGNKDTADNLVVYANIFQDNKLFAREYEDLAFILDSDKQIEYRQKYRVEPLTIEEIEIIRDPNFILEKKRLVEEKFRTR